MTALLMYDLIEAQLRIGGMIYKATDLVADDGSIYQLEHNGKILNVMHPNTVNTFIDMCTGNGVPVIPMDEFTKAEREAFQRGRITAYAAGI